MVVDSLALCFSLFLCVFVHSTWLKLKGFFSLKPLRKLNQHQLKLRGRFLTQRMKIPHLKSNFNVKGQRSNSAFFSK